MINNLDYRRLSIGGSDIPAILNISSFYTPAEIYNYKITGREKKIYPSQKHRLNIGKNLENYIIEQYESKYNHKIINKNEVFYNKKYKNFHATIDGMVEFKNIAIECKVVFDYDEKWISKEYFSDNVDNLPPQYICQAAHYRYILDADYIDIIILPLFGDLNIRIFRYYPDLEMEKNLIEIANKFWEKNILKKTPPAVKKYSDFSILYTSSINTLVATSILEELILQYKEIRNTIKTSTKLLDEIKIKILNSMIDYKTNTIYSKLENSQGILLAKYNKNLSIL
jgi:predicted phage-related endonuclease